MYSKIKTSVRWVTVSGVWFEIRVVYVHLASWKSTMKYDTFFFALSVIVF